MNIQQRQRLKLASFLDADSYWNGVSARALDVLQQHGFVVEKEWDEADHPRDEDGKFGGRGC